MNQGNDQYKSLAHPYWRNAHEHLRMAANNPLFRRITGLGQAAGQLYGQGIPGGEDLSVARPGPLRTVDLPHQRGESGRRDGVEALRRLRAALQPGTVR